MSLTDDDNPDDDDELTENTCVTLSITEPLMMLPIDRA